MRSWATGRPICLSPHASVKSSTRRYDTDRGADILSSQPVPFQKTVRNPDYRGRRCSCRRALLVSSLTAVRGPWLMVLARSLPSLALFWEPLVFVVVYWMRVTPHDGQATARTLRKDICRWLYTGGVWAQPYQKRKKFDEADEPFSLSEGCTLGVRSAIRGSGLGPMPFSQDFFFSSVSVIKFHAF